MAECEAPPAIGERVDVALDNADPVQATTLWVQWPRFGAEFASALPFEALWPPPTAHRAPQPARTEADRIVVDAEVIVHRLDDAALKGRVRNVSVRGMLIETGQELVSRQPVEVEVQGWTRRATVMWSRDGSAGLQLERPLTEVEMLELKMASAARHAAS